jgi:hypothetical protein
MWCACAWECTCSCSYSCARAGGGAAGGAAGGIVVGVVVGRVGGDAAPDDGGHAAADAGARTTGMERWPCAAVGPLGYYGDDHGDGDDDHDKGYGRECGPPATYFSGNNSGIHRAANAAGKVNRRGARELSDTITPRFTKLSTARWALRSLVFRRLGTSPRCSSPR